MNHRLRAIDWMRGIVMLLMVTDHASAAFNAGRIVPDSALFEGWDEPLPAAQYLFRWASHLCAPVFVCLAGTSLALSVERRKAAGASAWSIDRDLLVRGALILAVELFFINHFWGHGFVLLQVMFAIGGSMWAMIALRRLPDVALVAFAILSWIVGEWTRTGNVEVGSSALDAVLAVGIDAGFVPHELFGQPGVFAAYPLLPWTGMMAAGWVFGRRLLARGAVESRGAGLAPRLLATGLALLALFALLRWNNGFGNLGLLRQDDSILQWLHVSKYPPSLSFVALELGLMFMLLSVLFAVEARRGRVSSTFNPVLVFGQTAFFFYLAHIFLLESSADLTGLRSSGDLRTTCLASAGVIALLYPACLGYRLVKARYPRSLLRFF